jgi:DNA-binding response OmpR family regulator
MQAANLSRRSESLSVAVGLALAVVAPPAVATPACPFCDAHPVTVASAIAPTAITVLIRMPQSLTAAAFRERFQLRKRGGNTAGRHHGGMRILVVEDEPLLADAVAEWLRGDAHAVDVVHDGAAALERIGVHGYDVVVLDRDLPVVHGDDVCRSITAIGDARVLMLTAAAGIDDRVTGLALGADDYLPKPFAFRELAARVSALGRRTRPAAPPVLARAGIRLDTARREVFRDGRYVPLSRKEFAVLAELLRADGSVVSAEQLLDKAWDEHTDPFTGAVRLTILKLRRKLGDPPVIQTEPGVGYQIP